MFKFMAARILFIQMLLFITLVKIPVLNPGSGQFYLSKTAEQNGLILTPVGAERNCSFQLYYK